MHNNNVQHYCTHLRECPITQKGMAVLAGSLQMCVGALNRKERNEMPVIFVIQYTPVNMCTLERRICPQGERKSSF